MRLRELINAPERVVLDLRAGDRWQAIDELVDALVARGCLDAQLRDAVLAAVRQREQTMSTGIGNGIAIPHAACEPLTKVQGILSVTRHDIQFDASDGEPVRLVMLLLLPGEAFQEHLDTLADIARVLGKRDVAERLRVASAAAEIVDIIASA